MTALFLGSKTLVPYIKKRTNTKLFINPFLKAGVIINTNQVEDGPQSIPRIAGQEILYTITDLTTGFVFNFEIIGGTNPNLQHPGANFYLLLGTEVNCTVDNSTKNVFIVTTDAADSGGRVYTLTFTPFPSILPTIQKTGGAALGGNLQVVITDHY